MSGPILPKSSSEAAESAFATGTHIAPGTILVFATQGAGSADEARILKLISRLPIQLFQFNRRFKFRSGLQLLHIIWRGKPTLVVMEGTGFAGGIAIILSRMFAGVQYVVGTGDSVGPFLSMKVPILRIVFGCYERVLYRLSAGVVAWTPYLAGRALTYGAPRAMTAAGWAPFETTERQEARSQIRRNWKIPEDAIVFGMLGTLEWNPRVKFCYGAELARALIRTSRSDLYVLVVGGGTGQPELERIVGNRLGRTFVLTGKVKREEIADYLAAMDVASLPQSVDGVGSFRYTTKLSEYVASRLPIITGQIPLSYDLDEGWIWRLPGDAPWDSAYLSALVDLMNTLTVEEIEQKSKSVPVGSPIFNMDMQVDRATRFLSDLVARKGA